MIAKIRKHSQLKHFIVYCVSYIMYGMMITGLGPIIPYFSEKTGIIQTQYSFLFSCRSFGMLGGALLQKFLQNHFSVSHHKYLIYSTLVIVISSCLFSWATSPFLQGVWMTISSMGYAIVEIQINICALMTNPPQDSQFWLLLNHGAFGIGGLFGPFMIYVFEINAFAIIGVLMTITIPAYYILPAPTYNTSTQQDNNMQAQKITPRKIQALLCLALFIYIGLQNTYGGWISSYSILAGVNTKQGATLYPSVFWVMITLFRFVLAFLPGSTNNKMRILLRGTVASGVLSLFLVHLGYTHLACYLSAIIFGISMSSLYVLVLTISSEFGFTLAQYQTSNIVTCGVLGQGFLTMLVGISMETIHINMLFYGLIIMALMMEIDRILCVKYFSKSQTNQKENQTELLEKNISILAK